MLIRKGMPDDLGPLFNLWMNYATKNGLPRDRNVVLNFLRHSMTSWDSFLELAESKNNDVVGFFLGKSVPEIYYPEHYVAVQMAWLVKPKYRNLGIGKQLLTRFCEWSRSVGVKRIQIFHNLIHGPDLEKFYKSFGFKKVEYTYSRSL